MDYNRRVKFLKGQQHAFISDVAKKFGSLHNLATKIGVPYSSLKKYNQEILILPEHLFNKLLILADKIDCNLNFFYLEPHWGQKIGGKNGMSAIEKKYPDKIKEWRKLARNNSYFSNLKKIKLPIMDERFAEFVGVYLGDGTLTKYFIRISGDYRYDIPYYNYLNKLTLELFGIRGQIYRDKKSNTAYFVIFSKQLCDYFINNLKIRPGHKIRNNTLIPSVILENNDLSIACLRGLIDTDGSVSRRGKAGQQFTITFTSHNPNLLEQVRSIADKNSLFSFYMPRLGTLGTNNSKKILSYFNIVGSSNLRHIVRFHQRFFKNNTIYQREFSKYYQEDLYKDLILPYKVKALSSSG